MLGLFPRIVSEETRRQFWGWQPTGDNGRRLFEVGAEAEYIARERNEVWLDALMGLIDTLTTLACALALVLLLQLLAHLVWAYHPPQPQVLRASEIYRTATNPEVVTGHRGVLASTVDVRARTRA